MTYADFAKVAQAATGKDFQVLCVSLEDYQKGLAKGGFYEVKELKKCAT